MLAYHVAGVDVGLGSAIVVQSLIVFVVILPTSPASLGIREGVITLASGIVGVGLHVGLVAAAIDRAVLLCWTMLIGVPCTWWVMRRLGPREPANGQPAPWSAVEN